MAIPAPIDRISSDKIPKINLKIANVGKILGEGVANARILFC
jgi:hypothetical protein